MLHSVKDKRKITPVELKLSLSVNWEEYLGKYLKLNTWPVEIPHELNGSGYYFCFSQPWLGTFISVRVGEQSPELGHNQFSLLFLHTVFLGLSLQWSLSSTTIAAFSQDICFLPKTGRKNTKKANQKAGSQETKSHSATPRSLQSSEQVS